MMTIECAISLGTKRCARLFQEIEANESSWQSMDAKRRSEMGAWRCLMYNVGMSRDQLPEMPYLDPKHLENYKARQDQYHADQLCARCSDGN